VAAPPRVMGRAAESFTAAAVRLLYAATRAKRRAIGFATQESDSMSVIQRVSTCVWLMCALGASAQACAADAVPEEKDADVRRCVETAKKRFVRVGYDHAQVLHAEPRRADACILRWEAPFNPANPTKVATLIVVPVDLDLKSLDAVRSTTVHLRCGYTDGTMKAFEIVPADKPC